MELEFNLKIPHSNDPSGNATMLLNKFELYSHGI